RHPSTDDHARLASAVTAGPHGRQPAPSWEVRVTTLRRRCDEVQVQGNVLVYASHARHLRDGHTPVGVVDGGGCRAFEPVLGSWRHADVEGRLTGGAPDRQVADHLEGEALTDGDV